MSCFVSPKGRREIIISLLFSHVSWQGTITPQTHIHAYNEQRSRGTLEERAPDVVVVSHHIDALCVWQVAVVYEKFKDAPTAKFELLSDGTLQIRHNATCVQVNEQPAHAAVDDSRRRVVKV